jgi:hypothetical protein
MSGTTPGSVLSRTTLAALLVLSACTSATERLEQGIELETAGSFESAAYRYIDALDKDETLAEARERLVEVGDSAVTYNLGEVEDWTVRREYLEATRVIVRTDNLLAAARQVGVRLPVPEDYTQRRRAAFDNAIETYLADADAALDGARYRDAVESYRLARTATYEPTRDQRFRSEEGEAWSNLLWAQQEYDAGRLQSSFNLAGRVFDLSGVPAEVSDQARGLMDQALDEGQVEVMVLPVVVPARRASPSLLDLEIKTNAAFSRGALAGVPPFVRLTDDGAVRTVVREAAMLGAAMSPAALGLLLRLVEAEYVAYAEIVNVDATEYDLRQRNRTSRLRAGGTAAWIEETGDRRLRAQVRVIVVNRNGDVVADNTVIGTGEGRFRRGIYDGDPRELSLDRREVDAFDQVAREAQEQVIRQALAQSIASELGNAVFDPILARIP